MLAIFDFADKSNIYPKNLYMLYLCKKQPIRDRILVPFLILFFLLPLV